MTKFFALQNDFLSDGIDLIPLNAKIEKRAIEEIEEEIATNCSQEWLITEEQAQDLLGKLCDMLKVNDKIIEIEERHK